MQKEQGQPTDQEADIFAQLKREKQSEFIPDRARIVNGDLTYLEEVLKIHGYEKGDRMKFYNIFQLYMMYQFAALVMGLTKKNGEPDIKEAAKQKAEVDNIITHWSERPGKTVNAPGTLFQNLFDRDINFLKLLAAGNVKGANSYALEKFKDEFQDMLKTNHAADATMSKS